MGQMMKVATKSEQTGEHGESLEQVKQRFVLWREGRKRGERISNALWAAAVGLVERHGLLRTAQELRIDCDGLKNRIGRDAGSERIRKAQPQFVELFAPPALNTAPTAECIVEMENARGGKMRVELKSLDGLAGLASAFWGAR
jgi:hypothetical protein